MDVLVVTRDNVRRLLLAMLQPGTVYVLGAGTSAGLVPFTSGTLAFVRRRYAEVGVYAVDSSPSPLLDRVVIGPMVDAWKQGEVWFDEDLLVEKIPSSTLELLVQKAWSPCRHGTAPPQYSLCRKTLASEIARIQTIVAKNAASVRWERVEPPAGKRPLEWCTDP